MRKILKRFFVKYKSEALIHRFIKLKREADGYGTYFTSFQKFMIELFKDEPYSWENPQPQS